MRKLRGMFKSLKRMQNLWKVRAEHKNFLNIRKKIIKIQIWFRKQAYKKNLSIRRHNAILIQTYIRRYLTQKYNQNDLNQQILKVQNMIKRGIEKMRIIIVILSQERY